jgi:hypothetical protein
LIHFYIVDHTDEKERERVNARFTGPRLTDVKRIAQIKAQDPDMPPMPAWWDDDDASDSSIMAARQLGMM